LTRIIDNQLPALLLRSSGICGGSDTFLGCEEDFARISPKLTEKF